MLRAMGHSEVVVLDGGLPKWRSEGRPVEDMSATPFARHFSARPDHALVKDFSQMMENLGTKKYQVIDARGRGRFQATEPEPRPGMRGGHIPRSLNVPYTELTNPDGTFRSRDDLIDVFTAHHVDLQRPTITTCGSGITAASAMLALATVGAKDVSLYDGSWSEWGASDAPRETG
jgi:thiosulfate/3-mercaptopyruvate sulfurtransferase